MVLRQIEVYRYWKELVFIKIAISIKHAKGMNVVAKEKLYLKRSVKSSAVQMAAITRMSG